MQLEVEQWSLLLYLGHFTDCPNHQILLQTAQTIRSLADIKTLLRQRLQIQCHANTADLRSPPYPTRHSSMDPGTTVPPAATPEPNVTNSTMAHAPQPPPPMQTLLQSLQPTDRIPHPPSHPLHRSWPHWLIPHCLLSFWRPVLTP